MNTERLKQNAQITIEHACKVQAGDSVVIISEETNKAPYYCNLLPTVRALSAASVARGAFPMIIDVNEYVRSHGFNNQDHQLLPMQAAIKEADVVINAVDWIYFSRFTGESSLSDMAWKSDKYVTGTERVFSLQSNRMDEWKLSAEEVSWIFKRRDWLMDLLRKSETVKVTSSAGTDFCCGLGPEATILPFSCLVPLYGEIPLIPAQGTENGVIVVDGPTQGSVRPKDELDRKPLIVTIKDGKVYDYSGDDEQVDRLRNFIESGDPQADNVDEVGLLTTNIRANDQYWWEDGTHHSDRIHIALGNNDDRKNKVHGKSHMDMEINNPKVTVDNTVIIENGSFVDTAITEE